MIHNMVGTTDGFSIPTSIGSAEVFSHQQDTISGNPNLNPKSKNPNPSTNKKKRNLPGTPDPDSEVIALSPKTLMATNRFICEICNKGFQRDQNLQLHRRGHNLPWKLKQRTNKEPVKRKVYVCPEKTCVHHDPSRALGDLTGIKKHFSRKHGEKKWKCEKCSKKYAVQSDWKAHSKTCGTREYKCDCGTLFSRKDSFITHRAFCDALAEDSARFTSVGATNLNFGNDMLNNNNNSNSMINIPQPGLLQTGFNVCQGVEDVSTISPYSLSCFRPDFNAAGNNLYNDDDQQKPRLSIWLNQANSQFNVPKDIPISNSNFYPSPSNSSTTHNVLPEMVQMTPKSCSIPMSATALLQKAAQMGSTRSNPSFFGNTCGVIMSSSSSSSINNNIVGDVLPLVSTTSSNLMSSSLLLPNSSNSTFNNIGKANDTSSSSLFSLNQLTRDFLGVGAGGDHPQRQYLPQQLAKFANSMGLSQFTTNH